MRGLHETHTKIIFLNKIIVQKGFALFLVHVPRGETEWKEREKREGGMHGGRKREDRDEMRTKRGGREGGSE